MNRTEFWTIIGLLIAMMALMNFQFIHLSGRITDNADAIAEIRVDIAALRSDMDVAIAGLRSEMVGEIAGVRADMVSLRSEMVGEIAGVRADMVSLRSEMVGEIAGLRAEMAAGFAKLENLVIREVYANREGILQLEQRMTDVEEIIIDAPADGD